MRTGLFFLGCVMHAANLFAQRPDSILLPTATVYSVADERYLPGSSVHRLDSTISSNENSRSLGEILALQFPVYFRTYGNGMISGISMRGTSPQHTAVLWNGININSFSLGQADFSILPAAAFDEVSVHEGAGSARFGSGAFGGTVIINSKTPATNALRVTQDIGSFGRYFSSISASVNRGRWNFQTRAYHLFLKNNFTVPSSDERQQHASVKQSGVLQSIGYSWSEARTINVHYWYHDADREIQPTLSQVNARDTQQDRNHRLSVQFQNTNHFGQSTVMAGYINDVIIYDGSKSTIARSIAGAKHEFTIRNRTHIQMSGDWNHITGWIKEWQNGKATEDRYDFLVAAQRNFGKRLSFAINLRQPVVTGFSAPLLPYVGADYILIQSASGILKFRGSGSKNYRIPTLNDRYWQNAGDKTLSPELSKAMESGVSWINGHTEISITGFTQNVDDWIQWIPQANGNYRPKNIKKVRARGIEASALVRGKLSRVGFTSRVAYQYTSSITLQSSAISDLSVGRQLIYVPVNTGSAYISVGIKTWSVNIAAQYSGKRFTEASNSDLYSLPSYALVDISLAHNIDIAQSTFVVQFSAKNIFDHEYQLYAGRAMPGRNFNLQLIYRLKQKSHEHSN